MGKVFHATAETEESFFEEELFSPPPHQALPASSGKNFV